MQRPPTGHIPTPSVGLNNQPSKCEHKTQVISNDQDINMLFRSDVLELSEPMEFLWSISVSWRCVCVFSYPARSRHIWGFPIVYMYLFSALCYNSVIWEHPDHYSHSLFTGFLFSASAVPRNVPHFNYEWNKNPESQDRWLFILIKVFTLTNRRQFADPSFCPKGPIFCPITDLYCSSQTPVEQAHVINYPKRSAETTYLALRFQPPAGKTGFYRPHVWNPIQSFIHQVKKKQKKQLIEIKRLKAFFKIDLAKRGSIKQCYNTIFTKKNCRAQ